jgi:hypothetical protein
MRNAITVKDESAGLQLPYDPIDSAMKTPQHARRNILGILESYHSNYDIIAEAVQNSMDALEDAVLMNLPGPYLLEITVNLSANAISFFDTGVGMTQEQVCEAFAPSASFKEFPTIVKKRGDKYPYRGYKGVGLTFLAYGTDDIRIQSRQNGALVKGRMRFGRAWVEEKRQDSPKVEVDDSPTPLDKHKRGTYLSLQLSSGTRPQSLSHLGSTIEVWEAIIRTRSAAGQIFIGERPASSAFKIRLKLMTRDGTAEKQIDPQFFYPHLAQRNPPFRFLDIGEYHKAHPGIADHSEDSKRQDAVYVEWDTDEIKRNMEKEELKEFQELLDDLSPRLYAFRPYHAPLWTVINEAATKQHRTHYFGPGLAIGLNHQRIADITRVQVSRSEFEGQNVFVLVHFTRAKPDQGRKTLQPDVMRLAQTAADDAIQLLLKQNSLLKPAGEKTTSAQRAVERNHEEWVDNVKAHAKENPLSIAPVCYMSAPITEQDVVGIFNQFAALGLIPGLKIFSTSGQQTYDCYVRFDCRDNLDRLRYKSIGENPLGLSEDVLGREDKSFSTKSLTLEFKNTLEGLISDLESQSNKKAFPHIDICVCWDALEERHRLYTLTPITESNLHERRYPGITHTLRRDPESHVVQVILLHDIVKRISAGQIRL